MNVDCGLADDLGELTRASLEVPAAVDARIRNRARVHFAGLVPERHEHRPTRRRRTAWFAAVAAWALVAMLAIRAGNSGVPDPRLAGDLDRSGRIDIVDAMLLARRIAKMESTWPAWDVSGDGAVDGADVAAIASRAVSLGEAEG